MGILKEALVEYKRYKSDSETNNKKVTIVDQQTKSQKTIKWKDLKVGDVVLLHDKEVVPADILVLATNGDNGNAFCSTATLDGERTLKVKYGV